MVQAVIVNDPLKANGEATVTREQLEQQAEFARSSLVEVDYSQVRGTCSDERWRVGLLSGEQEVEPRPSAFGGPDVFALYMRALSGYYADDDTSTAEERLSGTKRDINRNGVRSGGHKKCAATASFGAVVGLVAERQEEIRAYTQAELGDDYDEAAMTEVFGNADKAVRSGKYSEENMNEDVLERVLGDEADEALQIVDDVPHGGKSLIRTRLHNKTVDQNTLHDRSGGEDSYVNDDEYCAAIENAAAGGPNTAHMLKVMRHAREALIKAISIALPNEELHEIVLQ